MYKKNEIINKTLIANLLKRKWSCEYCEHIYTKKELKHMISNAEDNQNCPNCNKLNT